MGKREDNSHRFRRFIELQIPNELLLVQVIRDVEWCWRGGGLISTGTVKTRNGSIQIGGEAGVEGVFSPFDLTEDA